MTNLLRAIASVPPRRLLRLRAPSPTKRRSARTSPSGCPSSRRSTRCRRPPIPGIYELRIGTDILYTDEHGSYLIEGQLIDTKSRVNLTEQRIAKLTAIDFKTLPLKDAIVWKQGTGERKLVVFADPNCGYCKKFERDLQEVKNVTVYTFLYPILGADSAEKSKAIWCAKDNTKAWRDWMIKGDAGREPARTATPAACSATSPSARSTASTARRAWCSRTAASAPARSTPRQIEKLLVASRAGKG